DAGILLIRSRQIGQHADLDLAAGHLGLRGQSKQDQRGETADGKAHVFLPRLVACNVRRLSDGLSSWHKGPVGAGRALSLNGRWACPVNATAPSPASRPH